MPQPIETAPKDGTVILTDAGICFWHERREKWLFCSAKGWLMETVCTSTDTAYPTLWEPLPDWITK